MGIGIGQNQKYRYRSQLNMSIGIGIGIGLKLGIGASLVQTRNVQYKFNIIMIYSLVIALTFLATLRLKYII